jgi:chromosome segregation ATPase
MKGSRFVVLLVSVGLLVAGCSGSKRLTEIERQAAKQATELNALKVQFEGVSGKTTAASSDIAALRQKQDAEAARIQGAQDALASEGKKVASLEVELGRLAERLDALAVDVLSLKAMVQTPAAELERALKIGYLDTEAAFAVFSEEVKDLRQSAVEKQAEIVSLQRELAQGKLSKEEYPSRLNELQVDLLQAQLAIDMGMIEKMIAAPGFADLRADLTKLRDEAQPVVEEMKNLVATVRVGVASPNEFQVRFAQVKTAFAQLDQLLTQAATVKIVRAAEKVAAADGYALVLRTKNVIIYRDQGEVTDLTELVKAELATYLE